MQLCRNHAASRRAPETIGNSAGTHENANAHQNLVATLPVFARQFERSLVDFVVGSIAAFFWSTGLNLSYELFERRARGLIAARQRGRHMTGTVNQRR